MIDIFFELKRKYSAEIKVEETTWFNGHAYLPLKVYVTIFSYKLWEFTVRYENRCSEFESKQYVSGGTFNSRHIYSIRSVKKNPTNDFADFSISEKDFLSKIFAKSKKHISSPNSEISSAFRDSVIIDKIFDLNDSEFSPYIYGKKDQDTYVIYFDFNLAKHDESIFNKLFDALLAIIDILENGNVSDW